MPKSDWWYWLSWPLKSQLPSYLRVLRDVRCTSRLFRRHQHLRQLRSCGYSVRSSSRPVFRYVRFQLTSVACTDRSNLFGSGAQSPSASPTSGPSSNPSASARASFRVVFTLLQPPTSSQQSPDLASSTRAPALLQSPIA